MIDKERHGRPDFDQDILRIWRIYPQNPAARIVSELRGAFNVRHWLAHGRYWTAKPGRKYDYATTFDIASAALSSFPLLGF